MKLTERILNRNLQLEKKNPFSPLRVSERGVNRRQPDASIPQTQARKCHSREYPCSRLHVGGGEHRKCINTRGEMQVQRCVSATRQIKENGTNIPLLAKTDGWLRRATKRVCSFLSTSTEMELCWYLAYVGTRSWWMIKKRVERISCTFYIIVPFFYFASLCEQKIKNSGKESLKKSSRAEIFSTAKD